MHCLICFDLQAPGDISFCRRGIAVKKNPFFLFISIHFFSSLLISIGGVYGGASTIRARLLPFINLEASYLNGLLSDTGSDLYPLAWWRYPYSHLRTEAEFSSLANEYERNLGDLELDLSHANVDNARLEAEYKPSILATSLSIEKRCFFSSPLDSSKLEQN